MFFHMLIDFDLQFLVMFLILILMQDLTIQKKWKLKKNADFYSSTAFSFSSIFSSGTFTGRTFA